jgi:peroxiredoxin
MCRTVVGALILALLPAVLAARDEPSPVLQYLNLKRQYAKQLQAFQEAYREAATPAAKQKALAEKHPDVGRFAAGFLALARDNPKEAFAVDALAWVVANPAGPATGTDARSQALDLLGRRHVADERLGPLCTQLIFSPDEGSEALLRRVLAKSPHEGAKARACVSLAQNLKFRARALRRLREDAEAVKQHQAAWGKAAVQALLKRDAEQLLKESEKLFRRVVASYGKVPHPQHGTLAKMAQAHLEALRQPVTVGEPAPEIKGEDHEGKALALSAQRGKVVLLDFGGNDFPPCRAAYARERALVKKMAARPFVLLGVSADGSRATLAKVRAAEGLSWRTWWDGGGIGGPTATRWEVELWPTLYLLDHKGVVRHVFVGWPGTKELDEALEALVRAAEGARKAPK